MKRLSRWMLGLVVVAALAIGASMSPQAEAGMICHDGRWLDADRHCQLGSAQNCTECWVWPK